MIRATSTPVELRNHARLWVWGLVSEIQKLPPLTRAILLKEVAEAALDRVDTLLAENAELAARLADRAS